MSGPLVGIKVIDFSAVVSGPFAAMWLADQGADVVKVESPGIGDITRGTGNSPDHHGLGGLYVNCNRGKKALCVDVATDEGRQIVLDLCRTADVFIQNWRPGVVERLGLGYEDVRAVNDRIIYVSISGYGPDGPYAMRRVYDPIIQGLSGHVGVQVNPEIPFPDLVRTIVCDKATSLATAQAVCAALFARERGAGGQHLIIPMLDTAVAFFFPDGYMSASLLDNETSKRSPTLAQVYRVQRTADGSLTYFCANDGEFFGLFRALGHPEWVEDPRFLDGRSRIANLPALGELMAEAFESWATDDLVPRLEAEQVPFGRVLSLEEVPQDPQVRHNEVTRIREHPAVGRILEARHPIRFSKTQPDITPLAPQMGADNEEVLSSIGRTAEQIAALRDAGVIA